MHSFVSNVLFCGFHSLNKITSCLFMQGIACACISINCVSRGERALSVWLRTHWTQHLLRGSGRPQFGHIFCYSPPSLPPRPIWSHFASSTDSEEELARSVSPFVVCLLHSTHAWPLFSARQLFQFKHTIAPRVASSCLHIFDQPHPRYILIITTCKGHY